MFTLYKPKSGYIDAQGVYKEFFKELFINSLHIYIATFRLMQCEHVDQKDFINEVVQGVVLSHLEVTFKKFNFLSGIRKLLGLVEDAIFYYKFPDIL